MNCMCFGCAFVGLFNCTICGCGLLGCSSLWWSAITVSKCVFNVYYLKDSVCNNNNNNRDYSQGGLGGGGRERPYERSPFHRSPPRKRHHDEKKLCCAQHSAITVFIVAVPSNGAVLSTQPTGGLVSQLPSRSNLGITTKTCTTRSYNLFP